MHSIMVSGLGLAFIGVAVAIGAWLAPPDTLDYGVRFSLVAFAIICLFVGVVLLVVSCVPHVKDVLSNLWSHLRDSIKWQSNQATEAATKTSDETENDRWHNRRSGPLKIEFSNDYTFKSIGSSQGHGIHEGQLQIYRVAVRNTTEEDIVGVQVWLESITPMPPEFMGHGGLPLHVTHEAQGVSMITLRPHENRRVDVVSYFDSFWNPHIRIEHTSAIVKHEIYEGDDGYEIELVAKGNKVEPFRRKFKVGVNNKDLYMVSLEQPEEETMVEGYRDA